MGIISGLDKNHHYLRRITFLIDFQTWYVRQTSNLINAAHFTLWITSPQVKVGILYTMYTDTQPTNTSWWAGPLFTVSQRIPGGATQSYLPVDGNTPGLRAPPAEQRLTLVLLISDDGVELGTTTTSRDYSFPDIPEVEDLVTAPLNVTFEMEDEYCAISFESTLLNVADVYCPISGTDAVLGVMGASLGLSIALWILSIILLRNDFRFVSIYAAFFINGFDDVDYGELELISAIELFTVTPMSLFVSIVKLMGSVNLSGGLLLLASLIMFLKNIVMWSKNRFCKT